MKLKEEEKLFLRRRTEKKIEEVEKFLNSLIEIRPNTLEEYERNTQKRFACERLCEILAEASVDLAIFIIRYKEIPYNEEDEKAFGVLLKNKVIDEKLSINLRKLKGMRDHIAHRYGEIDNNLVFNSVTNEVGEDINAFIIVAKKAIKLGETI